jgi:hypothetical protein
MQNLTLTFLFLFNPKNDTTLIKTVQPTIVVKSIVTTEDKLQSDACKAGFKISITSKPSETGWLYNPK